VSVYVRGRGALTGVDAGRRQWLGTVAAGCERVLARRELVESADPLHRALVADVVEFLKRVRSELEAGDVSTERAS
jgi:hypothetical protein